MSKIRYAMVGGGRDAFIGAIHRIAASMDNRIELVAGAFSSDPRKSKESGADLLLPSSRVYENFQELISRESALPFDLRPHFISIVTPNHVHFPIAKAALLAGFHVLSDKPATISLDEALSLREIVKQTKLLYCLSHNYTGYPMIKQARDLIARGEIGTIRKIAVEYLQGWLSKPIEASGQKQAVWRTDPSRSGAAGCMGDIGTHAANLASYVTGLSICEVAADLSTFVEGRALDDDGNVLLRFTGGAKGVLNASQISAGEENNLTLRVYGEKGGIEWHQNEPNSLFVKWLDKPTEVYRTGHEYICQSAKKATRTPPAHPEGYLEAFANIYLSFADAVGSFGEGHVLTGRFHFPSIQDAVEGMAFIAAVVESSANGSKWIPLRT
jgi:predicted dehydrogenase